MTNALVRYERWNNWARGQIQLGMMAGFHALGRDRFRPQDFEVVPIDLPIPNLPAAFAGYRLVQISDLHVGHWLSLDRLAGVAALVNAQQPDCVVITGDFVSYVVDQVQDGMIASLSAIQAPDGVVGIMGNHDHWMGARRITELLQQAGLKMLFNEVLSLRRGAAQLYIAGLDDITVGLHDMPALLHALPDDGPAILLAHEPDFADQAAATGRFACMLSGHSHGGQIVLPRRGVLVRGPMFKKYPNGMYQVGDMLQYTNRGVGTHVLRLRINCPPEITVFTLQPG